MNIKDIRIGSKVYVIKNNIMSTVVIEFKHFQEIATGESRISSINLTVMDLINLGFKEQGDKSYISYNSSGNTLRLASDNEGENWDISFDGKYLYTTLFSTSKLQNLLIGLGFPYEIK